MSAITTPTQIVKCIESGEQIVINKGDFDGEKHEHIDKKPVRKPRVANDAPASDPNALIQGKGNI